MSYIDFESFTGGFKHGEMAIVASSRQSGKSHFYQKMLLESIYNTNLCKEILLPMHLKPKYKFSRAHWYVAEFDWKNYDLVDAWCEQQFGPQPDCPDAWTRWYHHYTDKVHFRDEKDYVLFVLRWS